jgi:hypothetical protein
VRRLSVAGHAALVVTFTVLALARVAAGADAPGGLASTRALRARLAATGRATASITVSVPDPMGGAARVERGRLALEPPDRLRLDFPASGECIAVRRDGGEWLQPSLRQLVRIRPEQAALASWLWDVFLRSGADRFRERSTGARRFALTPRDEKGLPDDLPLDLGVLLDPRGLPARLMIGDSASGGVSYSFEGWRFTRPRGSRAFVLAAPPGYSIVELP